MNKLLDSFNRDHQVYLFAIMTSLLLSLLIGYRDSVINPDGICYLMSAQVLETGSIKDAMQFCPQAKWPFYSMLIYAFQQISHFSFNVSAHLLNGILSLISVIAFIKIIETLGANQRILWLAALVILFDHQFNILRDNIIRDHGFWAFYLLSIYFLLKWFQKPGLMMALLWNASLIIATLFRIEGSIFLLAMPFVAFFQIQQPFLSRIKNFFILNIFLILIGTAFGVKQLLYPDGLHQLGRVNELNVQLQNGLNFILGRYYEARLGLLTHILPPDAAPDVNAIIILGGIGWYLYNVLLTLGFGYGLLLLYAFKTRAANILTPVILGYIIINVLMTLGFMAESLFISKRYLVALMLLLLLFIPFAVNDLLEKWNSMRHRIFLIIMASAFFISALSGVVEFGRSKYYIRTAGNWIATEIPKDAKLYANDYQLMYYSKHFGNQLFETLPAYLQIKNFHKGKWKEYDYVALRSGKHEEAEMVQLQAELKDVTPVKIFSDKKGNQVAVYQIIKSQDMKKSGETK